MYLYIKIEAMLQHTDRVKNTYTAPLRTTDSNK